jgi:hypothetical protein
MKAITLCIMLLACCMSTNSMGQFLPAGQVAVSFAQNHAGSVNYYRDSLKKSGNPVLDEWKYGAKWALFSTAGIAFSALAMVVGGEGGAILGLFAGFVSICTLPVFVSIGVNKIGKMYNPAGKSWKAVVGATVGTGALLAIEIMIFNNRGNSSMGNSSVYMIFPMYLVGAFAMVPLASVLTYNLFGHAPKATGNYSLLNFQNRKFQFGTPVPVVYPNPLMQGKICSQISLLSVAF